jgi:hypothetical protein
MAGLQSDPSAQRSGPRVTGGMSGKTGSRNEVENQPLCGIKGDRVAGEMS